MKDVTASHHINGKINNSDCIQHCVLTNVSMGGGVGTVRVTEHKHVITRNDRLTESSTWVGFGGTACNEGEMRILGNSYWMCWCLLLYLSLINTCQQHGYVVITHTSVACVDIGG